MTNEQPRQLDSNILAVLHNAAGRWSVLVADISGPRPKISAARQFESKDTATIHDWLDSQQVSAILAVVPASAVICRTCMLPDVSDDELAQGLELQAEAHLNGIAPEHRTAKAVLPAAEGESSRSGLILAWPESSPVEFPEFDRPVLFTADVAAIGALLDVQRPEQPVVWVDRHSDALALAITHTNGVAFRVTRERAIGNSEMVRSVQRAIAETALNVGHSPSYVESVNESTATQLSGLTADAATLILPADVKGSVVDRVDGTGADIQWWSQFGIAVGALLARTGPLHTLTTMIDAPPMTAPSIVHRIVDQLSVPRTAVKVVVAAVLLLALSPLLFNGMRLLMLNLRYSELDEKRAQVERAHQSLTMYKELEEQAWPMTKLLADIANCTPLGIELEVIRIRQGQFFTVAGTASPNDKEGLSATENIALMEQQLRDTRIFTEVRYAWGDPTANGQLEFDLNAKIVRPYYLASYDVEQDFGRWPHEARRNGDPIPDENTRTAVASGAESSGGVKTSGPTTGALAKTNDDTTRSTGGAVQPNPRVNTNSNAANDDGERETRPNTRLSNNGGRDNRDLGNIDNREKTIDPNALPEFLSDATIGTLSRQETMSHLAKVAKANKAWGGDEDTKAKLDEQHQKLMDRLKELRK